MSCRHPGARSLAAATRATGRWAITNRSCLVPFHWHGRLSGCRRENHHGTTYSAQSIAPLSSRSGLSEPHGSKHARREWRGAWFLMGDGKGRMKEGPTLLGPYVLCAQEYIRHAVECPRL